MIKISKFFRNELCDYSNYSTIRGISSAIDGLKNSGRKVIYTSLRKLKNQTKVSQFGGIVSIDTEYLHGCIDGTIVSLTQEYCGSNNLPLLKGEGNFGTRFVNDPSASRYIYVENQKYINELFDVKDVLIEQNFEGQKIEPLFFVPLFPLIFVNGAMNGLASGFKQHILPRNPVDIVKYFLGKKTELIPYFKGFKGKVYKGENPNQWIIEGKISRKPKSIIIEEIPVFIEYKKYLGVLEDLEDNKKIKRFEDFSDSKLDEYKFEVFGINHLSDDEILDLLKLRKKETELYNALDRNNCVKTFENVEEILDYYKEIRLEFLELQRNFDLNVLNNDLDIAQSKYKFISMIIKDQLKIQKRNKSEIIKDLSKTDLFVNDNYEYLLRMPVHSFTNETLKELKEKCENLKVSIKTLKNLNLNDNWNEKMLEFKL